MQRAGAVIFEMPFAGMVHTVVAYSDQFTLTGLSSMAEQMFEHDWVFVNPEWLTYQVSVHQCRIRHLFLQHPMASWNGMPT